MMSLTPHCGRRDSSMSIHKTAGALINSVLLVFAVTTPSLAADTEQMIRDAIAYHDQAEYQQAIDLLREVVRLEPDNGFAAYELAYSHQANGDLKDCAKVAGRALRKIRKDEAQARLLPQLSMMQASCYSEAGNTRKALKTFEKALQTSPDDFWLHFNISITLANVDRLDEAIDHLETAIRINPRHPSPYYAIGSTYYESDQPVNAFLAYANFLQREFNTERCVNASRWMIDVMFSRIENDDANNSTTILLPRSPDMNSPEIAALNLALGLAAMTNAPTEKGTALDAGPIADSLASFISIAGEMKFDSDPESFFVKHLVSGARAIEAAGVGTAFSYFVTSVAGVDGATEWLESHDAETDALVSYLESLSIEDAE